MRYSTELIINLSELGKNIDQLRNITPNNKIIFMVKADAYGHGILEVVRYAFVKKGIQSFGCASLGEAIKIRKKLPELDCRLFVFSDTEISTFKLREKYLEHNIIPVIHNYNDLKTLVQDEYFKDLPLVIKIDTGMYRLGMSDKDIPNIISLLHDYKKFEISHLMTHFSSSYLKLKNGDKTQRQLIKFQAVKELFQNSGIKILESSCANSGAIEQKVGLEDSHIRPGLMLYGPQSLMSSEKIWKGRGISTFKTKIIKIMSVKKGMPIGYGGHVCGHDGYVAILPVGYGDGILTYYSGRKLTVQGIECQILGRVNMDLTAIFFKEKNNFLVKGGDFVFWDDSPSSVVELATRLKTIPYQVFTAITDRVPRKYLL